jgi:dihydroxyacetone kinase-like protein
MNGPQLTRLLREALPRMEACRDELRDLDAAIGDGDLGITVAGGAAAIVRELPAHTTFAPAVVLQQAAGAFAAANPSTLSALVAGGLLAAARELGSADDVDRAAAIRLLTAAIERIQQRGHAEIGDKTILDAMAPSLTALRQAPPDDPEALRRMIQSAESGISSTTEMVSQRGRAAWVGERSIGHPDAGATAYQRLLEALNAAWAEQSPAAER